MQQDLFSEKICLVLGRACGRHLVLRDGEQQVPLPVVLDHRHRAGVAMERDPKAVVHDVAQGYVSVNCAAEDYAVAITTDGVQDMEKTSELRKAAGQ